MGRNTRLAPYGEQTYREQTVYDDQPVESLDEPADGPEFLAYGSTPSMAKRDYFLPEDIPLFLSNDTEEPKPRRFGSGGERDFHRPAVRSQFIKAGLLAVSAAAIVAALLSVENPLALFANAKASLIGVQANATPQSAPEPVVAARAATAQPAPAANPSSIGLAALPASAQAAPTRDEIALALKAAHQGPPEIRPPAAAPPLHRRPRYDGWLPTNSRR